MKWRKPKDVAEFEVGLEAGLSGYALRANNTETTFNVLKVQEFLKAKDSIRKRLVIGMLMLAAALRLGKRLDMIDWSAVDWVKVLETLLPILLQILMMFI